MKKVFPIALFALALATSPTRSILAHEPPAKVGASPKVEGKPTFGSLGTAWTAVNGAAAELEKGIAAKDGAVVHEAEERLTDALSWLESNSASVLGDKATRLAAALKQAKLAAQMIHEGMDAKDFAKAESDRKKLKGALKLVEAQYPPDALKVPASGTVAMPSSHADQVDHENMPGGGEPTLKSVVLTKQPLAVGAKAEAVIRLSKPDGQPVLLDDLAEAHTEKIHLLIIDASLTDYRHVHPRPTGTPGEYAFTFTPLKPGPYRVWADLVPSATNKQEYAMTDIAAPAPGEAITDRAPSTRAVVDGFEFVVTFDSPVLRVGEAAMGSVTIRGADKQPFTKLEPLMGAYAHLVGFSEDYKTIAHIHPMGAEPTKPTDRGGPSLDFHIQPAQAGLVRLFVQVQIDGKDRFAPVTLIVASAASSGASPAAATRKPLGAALDTVTSEYAKIQQALAQDSLAGIGPATAAILSAAKASPSIFAPVFVSAVAALGGAKDLEAARAAFRPVSAALILIVAANGGGSGRFEVYCPMAKAAWIQTSREIRNPYYGGSMLDCGGVKREL